jgi:hypothetical protein
MSNKELDDQYKNSKSSYEVFYDNEDETKVTQYRFHLEDDDPEIKNKHLCISKIHFTEPVILFYERHRTIGDKKIIEYYANDEMSIYEEITTENSVTIVKGLSEDGYLVYEDKTYHDADGNEVRHEHWVKSEDGTLYDCYDDTGAIDIDIPDTDKTPS